MNKSRFILLIGLLSGLMSSCEKDDLCIPEELDIPRLNIVFVDARNQLLRKPVSSLQVIESSTSRALPLYEDGATTLTQVDSISIPLPVDFTQPIYRFIRSENQVVNADSLQLNYIQDQVYLNRACGFKAIYRELTADRFVEPANQNWISAVFIRQSDVTTNQDIHVEIRH